MKYLSLCLLFLTITPLNTAMALTAIELQQQQIIQQQQQRQQALRQRIEQQQKQHQSIDISPLSDIDKTPAGPCFDISSIMLDGADHMFATSQQSLTLPFVNQCIDLDKINQLLKDISQWYFDQGYVTSRAYVTVQDLSSGQLTITIIEGIIEAFKMVDPTSRINTSTAFPSHVGELLNLQDIEQGLEQINRLQSNQVSMDILPGSAPGLSVINVQSQTSKPWVISLSRDNSGQGSTGELMNGLFTSVDNLFGLNDYTYLNLQKENTSDTGKSSESIGWHWDMPLGYWNMGIDVHYFDYLTTLNITGNKFETSGTSLTQRLFLSRVLYRNQDSKLILRTHLERKKIENFIEDVLLDNSSRTLSIGSIGLEYDQYLPNQIQWQLALNYYRGLRLFDAPDDDKRLTGSPKAQFEKFIARIDYQKQGSLNLKESLHIPLLFQSQLQLQYSGDKLFGSEQFSIGGLYTVRGYKDSSISASSGAYWRNTITLPWHIPSGGNVLQNINPFIAFDIGTIRDKAHSVSHNSYTDLKGWAIGTQFSGNHYTAKLIYARPISTPHELTSSQEQWYFNISMTL